MSFAMMPVAQAKEWAETYLALREAALHRLAEDGARRVRQWTKPNALMRLFGAKEKTFEEALAHYKSSDAYAFDKVCGKTWVNASQALLTLCNRALEHGVKEVSVDAELVVAFEKYGVFAKE